MLSILSRTRIITTLRPHFLRPRMSLYTQATTVPSCQPGVPAPATSLFRSSSANVALAMAQRLGEYILYRRITLQLIRSCFTLSSRCSPPISETDLPLCGCAAIFLVHGSRSSAGDGNGAGHRRCPEGGRAGQVIVDMTILYATRCYTHEFPYHQGQSAFENSTQTCKADRKSVV